MSFPNFPSLSGISWPVRRSPEWSLLKQDSIGGQRSRFPLWSSPRWHYELPYSMLRSDSVHAEWQTLVGFWNLMQSQSNSIFQFQDQNDNSVSNQSIGLGDGTTTNFQAVRTLGNFVEPIYQVTGAPTVKVNGVTKVNGTDYNISANIPGVIVFVTAPASGATITLTCTFNWLCRFDDDQVNFDQFAFNFWELKKIMLSTEKF